MDNTDLLLKMVNAQRSFRVLLGKGEDPFAKMTEQEKGERLYHTLVCIIEETMEVMATLNYKSHCKEAKEGRRFTFKNKAQTKEELADICCYFLDTIELAGMTPEELVKINVAKTEVNKQRQLRNYSQAEKQGNEAGADSQQLWKEIQEPKELPNPPPRVFVTMSETTSLKKKFFVLVQKSNGDGVNFDIELDLLDSSMDSAKMKKIVFSKIGEKLGEIFEIADFSMIS